MNGANCGLHPLIHTLLELNLAQDVESIRSGAEAPSKSTSSVFEGSSPRQNINARIVLDCKKKEVGKRDRVSGNQCHKEGTEQA